jgi:hypothetical protein
LLPSVVTLKRLSRNAQRKPAGAAVSTVWPALEE